MTIGQLVFAELPFATVGQLPYVERGWMKVCEKSDQWGVQPKGSSGWSMQLRRESDWSNQEINNVNTIGCGELRPIIRRETE